MSFNVAIPISVLRFNYAFTSPAEGLLTVFFDNNVVFRADQRNTLAGVNDSTLIPLGQVTTGTHNLAVRLDSFNGTLSAVQLSNLRTGLMQAVLHL